MRVLHVVASVSPSTGGSTNIVKMARSLKKHGVETLVVTTVRSGGHGDVPLGQTTTWRGVDTIFHDTVPIGGRWGLSPSLRRTLRRVIPSYDLVHVHWLYDYSSLAATREAVRAGVPYLIAPHGSLDPHLSKKNRLGKRIYLSTVGRRLMPDAEAVVFTAEEERRLASYGVRGTEWIVPVGIDTGEFDSLPPPGLFRETFPAVTGPFLLFLGRVSPQKGLDLLLKALRDIHTRRPDLWLVIAGPDYREHRAVMERLARDLGVAHRVLFTGLLDHLPKLAAFVDAELFVLPSYAENFGLVIIEALACGLPVVTSDQVNIHQELADARAATIVECTVGSVVAGIESALADPALRARTRLEGPALVRARYTWDAIVPGLITKYQGVLDRARLPRRNTAT